MREELDQNDLELELSSSKRAHMQELYKRLHVCKALTGNPNFYASGNGLGISFENKLVLWFSNERIEGKPNKRVRKSSVSNYLQQDAIDGLIAFANIAERYAPYEWKAKEHSDTSERDKRELLKNGTRILLGECGFFVDRFGLPHMRSDGEGAGTRKNEIYPDKLILAEPGEINSKGIAHRRQLVIKHEERKDGTSHLKQNLKARGLYDEDDPERTDNLIFHDVLHSVAKDFSGIYDFQKEQSRIKKEESALIDAQRKARLYDHYDEMVRVGKKIAQLRVDQGILILAAENAFRKFNDEERSSISDNGIIDVDTERLYRIGLLFRDALELHSAIQGDEKAFRRVLGKIHMEYYKASFPYRVHDGNFDAQSARLAAESRFTIWFESSGCDLDNPGHNPDDSNIVLNRNEYETTVFGTPLVLQRKQLPGEQEEHYGCGLAIHALCEAGETPEQFEVLARKYLPTFLNGLIKIGIEHNYKHLFANPALISGKNPSITVNDFQHDLVRTLWTTMELINKEVIPLSISRCKCCGRLMNTAREAGHAREFCDASCRSLYRKRRISQNETGQTNADAALRHRFLEFEESPLAIHIGMASHMIVETAKETESNDDCVFKNETTLELLRRYWHWLKKQLHRLLPSIHEQPSQPSQPSQR